MLKKSALTELFLFQNEPQATGSRSVVPVPGIYITDILIDKYVT